MKSIPAKPIMVCLVGTFKFLDSPTRHLYKELKEVRIMKPYRMINMALAILLPIFLIYTGMPIEKLANITQTIMNGVLAFVYPAIIFFSFWAIGEKFKKEELNNKKYYLSVILNVITPYIICMVPYIIYYEGELTFLDFLKTLALGNQTRQFTYVKSYICLLLIYPLIKYFSTLDYKRTLQVSIIVSGVLSVFKIQNLIHTDMFSYIAYMAFANFFVLQPKEANKFIRKWNDRHVTDISLSVGAMIFTICLKLYNHLIPLATIMYSFAMIMYFNRECFRYKCYYPYLRSMGRGYILDFIRFNPKIIATSIYLTYPIILEILKRFGTVIVNLISIVILPYVLFVVDVAILFIIAFWTDKYYKKYKSTPIYKRWIRY